MTPPKANQSTLNVVLVAVSCAMLGLLGWFGDRVATSFDDSIEEVQAEVSVSIKAVHNSVKESIDELKKALEKSNDSQTEVNREFLNELRAFEHRMTVIETENNNG